MLSCTVMSYSLWSHGLWNSPCQNTRVGSLSLLQRIFPTQGSNPGLTHCRQILYQLSHKGSPRILEGVAYPFSRRSSHPKNQTGVSCIAGGFFTNWAMRKAQDIDKLVAVGPNWQHPLDHQKSKSVPEKHLLMFYWLHQSLWWCGSQQTVESSSRDENTRPPYRSPEKSVCGSRGSSYNWTWNNRLVPNWEKYIKAVYCHPTYLTYLQSTSYEMLGWMKHKLESRLPKEISITSDMQMTPPLWQKVKKN